MMRRRLPWVLMAGALALFLLAPGANGSLLVAIWGVIILGSRVAATLMPPQGLRLWLDALVGLGCALAAFEGGWYLLPAVAAFAAADWRAGRDVALPSGVEV